MTSGEVDTGHLVLTLQRRETATEVVCLAVIAAVAALLASRDLLDLVFFAAGVPLAFRADRKRTSAPQPGEFPEGPPDASFEPLSRTITPTVLALWPFLALLAASFYYTGFAALACGLAVGMGWSGLVAVTRQRRLEDVNWRVAQPAPASVLPKLTRHRRAVFYRVRRRPLGP
jgi:hypothetical protein